MMFNFWSAVTNCTEDLKIRFIKEIEFSQSSLPNHYNFTRSVLLYSFLLALGLWTSLKGWKTEKPAKRRKIPVVQWWSTRVRFIDALYTPFKLRNDGVKMFEDLHRKYGSIYELSFGPIKGVITSDAAVIKKLLTSSSIHHLNKPKYIYHKIFENVLRNGLIVADHQTWSFHRGIANRSFSYRNLQNYLKIMNTRAKNIVQDIQQQYPSEEELEIHKITEIIDFQVLAIMAEALWGPRRYTDESNHKSQRSIHKAKEITLYRLMHPELCVGWLWKMNPKKWELDRLWKELEQSLKHIIEACKSEIQLNSSESSDGNGIDDTTGFCDVNKSFKSMSEEMIHSGMSDNEIHSEIATFLIAGFETTITTLNTVMFHLALNPDIQEKCQEEIDELFNSRTVDASEFEYDLCMKDVCNLKYIERCILENFRLTAPVPVYARRLDASLKVNENLQLNAGQVVVMVPWVLHRDCNYFPDPMKFDPDRFLPENIKDRDPYTFIPFSKGARDCLGKKFAMMEMKVILAWILRYFCIYTTDKLESIKFFTEASLRPERAIKLTLKRRKNVNDI